MSEPEMNHKAIMDRFRHINEERIKRAYGVVRPSQRNFLELLPFLWHANSPHLPGFVDENTPHGIWDYKPDKDLLLRINQQFSRQYLYRRPRQTTIMALYAMGSVGSLAHDSGSDFDFWLCYAPRLLPTEVDLLQQKATLLEQAAAKIQLEIHFFLINADQFRGGMMSSLSSESSGTTQHHLLLDEFYRTVLLLAGQFPAWWLVPPERESQYTAVIEEMRHRRYIFVDEMLDLGSLDTIQIEEFFGASLWQFYKAIESPYKSMIKLLLIESYIQSYPRIQLLSHQFKSLIYAGVTDLDQLDPYCLLVRHLEEYLQQCQDRSRLELLRRAFYFKVNIPLSNLAQQRVVEWRRQLLEQMIGGWRWGSFDLSLLDRRSEWDIIQVTQERQNLSEALSNSYRSLSTAVQQFGGKTMISERDLTILGRKLFAAYERKAGKVEIISRGIAYNLHADRLSLHEIRDSEGRSIWQAFTGYITGEERRGQNPVKQSRSLVEVVAWCYFNTILDKSTVVSLFTTNLNIDKSTLQKIIDRLFYQFPLEQQGRHPIENFSRPAVLTRTQFFINVGLEVAGGFDPQKYKREGRGSEPLSYGFANECLLKRFDFIYSTSWGEVMTSRYLDEDGVADTLCHYFKWYPCGCEQRPAVPEFMAMGISQGTSITYRMTELFTILINYFYSGEDTSAHRYLLTIGSAWYLFLFGSDRLLKYRKAEGYEALLQLMSQNSSRYINTLIDSYALHDRPLSHCFRVNRCGAIQFFYQIRQRKVDIWVLDERGVLYTQQGAEFYDSMTLISQFNHFFESVMNRIGFLAQEGLLPIIPTAVEYYLIERNNLMEYSLVRQSLTALQSRRFLTLQVLVDSDDQRNTLFTLYCEGREFSSLEYGNGLFKVVVEHILAKRPSGEAYPIYITDISMSPNVIGGEGASRVETTLFLKYKERIEQRLNQVLQRVAGQQRDGIDF